LYRSLHSGVSLREARSGPPAAQLFVGFVWVCFGFVLSAKSAFPMAPGRIFGFVSTTFFASGRADGAESEAPLTLPVRAASRTGSGAEGPLMLARKRQAPGRGSVQFGCACITGGPVVALLHVRGPSNAQPGCICPTQRITSRVLATWGDGSDHACRGLAW